MSTSMAVAHLEESLSFTINSQVVSPTTTWNNETMHYLELFENACVGAECDY